MRTISAALAILVGSAAGVAADERPGIRPGMGLAAVEAALKGTCKEYVVTGDSDRFVSCRFDGRDNGAVVAATISPKDRTYFVSWREPAQGDAASYARQIAAGLGFAGPGEDCKLYDYPMLCWSGGDGTVLYSAEQDAQGRYVNYLINEAIEQADTAE
ncbi:MAG: hypothetical protein F9K19_06980 [Rhizobiaceae bacterium]|nr:MAG: hypothetical protein F9K19_06980 [Rhizobiaceae bacterium]CAG1015992.1 hypothetical protein RHIZO_05238 [Rhizobiaceae bacterium]